MGARPVSPASAHDASRLLDAAKALLSTLDRERVLVSICHEAATILDAEVAVIYSGDAERGLKVQAAYGLDPELQGLKLASGDGLAGLVAERGEAMLTNDYITLANIPPAFAAYRSGLAVPIRWDGALRGVLSVGWKRDFEVSDEDLALLSAFGELAAAAARNADQHAGLERKARTDALTGCLNRPTVHGRLEAELERCRRDGTAVSLVMLDLDDFKQVNEGHGHLVGDDVLRCVGRGLREAIRAYDFVGRYGGDEFALVAVGAAESAAAEVASRALARVRGATEELGLGDLARATAGVAEWDGAETATALIARADHALLWGKQTGRRGVALRASQAPAEFRLGEPQLALSESR